MQGNFERELTVAVKAIKMSGEMLKAWSKPLEKEWKGVINPVTSADKESEEMIIKAIQSAFPDDIIVSEERNPVEEISVKGKRRWYLDPLDGTVNFMRGIPHWCISLALVNEEDLTVCSAVYAPMVDEMYTAIRGKGAWCNGEKLEVSQITDLNRSVAVSGFPYSFDDPNTNNLLEWTKITPLVLTIRSLGAAAKDLCELAKGRVDIFWEQGLERWDITAASLICKEAGATVTDINGRALEGSGNNVIAANPILHEKVIQLFRES